MRQDHYEAPPNIDFHPVDRECDFSFGLAHLDTALAQKREVLAAVEARLPQAPE